MRALVLGLGALAACYSPRLPANLPCENDQQCPREQRCVLARCSYGSAPPVDGALDDAAIGGPAPEAGAPPPEAGAACTVVPANQHDEDGDGAVDSLDPCPLVRESAPGDTDGDGVSDRCDRGGGQVDRVVFFEAFQCGLPPTSWSTINVTGDRDVVTLGGSTSGAIGSLAPAEPLPDHTTASFLVTIAPSPQVDQFVEVALVGTGDHIITCTIDTAAEFFALDEELAPNSVRPLASASVPLDPNGRQLVRLGRDGTTYGCEVFDASGNVFGISGSAVRAESGDMAVKFATYGVSAAVDSLLIVGRVP